MKAIVNYLIIVFTKIVDILNIQIFSDFPITYLQLIMCSFVIGIVFKFLFMQQSEIETQTNWMNRTAIYDTISNLSRKKQVTRAKNQENLDKKIMEE